MACAARRPRVIDAALRSPSVSTHTLGDASSPTTAFERDVIERVTQAHAARLPLRIVGGGTWLDAGRPIPDGAPLSMADHTGVINYEPGDLVISVRCGTTLAELASVTAPHGQWFALDPMGSDASTIGATIATASSGPLALGSGAVRDLVLGLSVITGAGARIRVGGHVVKNVAGFDLVRLCTGAWGTLGVITEVSVRLHARPAVDSSFIIEHDEVHALLDIVTQLGLRGLSFHALEIVNPPLAHDIGAGDVRTWALAARATGNAASVAALRASLAAFGRVRDASAALWSSLQEADGDGATFRSSAAPSRLADSLAQVMSALAHAGLQDSLASPAHASLGAGSRDHMAQGQASPSVQPLVDGAVVLEQEPSLSRAPTSPITSTSAAARIRLTPGRGTMRVIIPSSSFDTDAERDAHSHRIASLISALRATTHRVIGERLPSAAWHALPPTATDVVSSRLRDAFDPHRIMNRGIFGEASA